MPDEKPAAQVIDLEEERARRAAQVLPRNLTKEEARNLLITLEALMDGEDPNAHE